MNGYKSNYTGQEIESILDKIDSFKINTTETGDVLDFDSLTLDGITYKIPKQNQLGLYAHNISMGIYDGSDTVASHISIEGGSNVISFTVYNTDPTPLTITEAFTARMSLSYYTIKYNMHLSPVTMYHAVMIGVLSTSTAKYLSFAYGDTGYAMFDLFKEFRVRDFVDNVEEVTYGS